jgi:hypothetical protein
VPAHLDYYLEEHAKGLGKNFLHSENLSRSLAAYVDYLWFFLMQIHVDKQTNASDAEMTAVVSAIKKELGASGDAKVFLAAQKHRLPAFQANILTCLSKDDTRGRHIFEDYGDFHPAPAQDPVYIQLAQELAEFSNRLDVFCAQLEK